MLNVKQVLKSRYGLVVGELALDGLKRKVMKNPNAKVRVSGRSCGTGRKKTIVVNGKVFLTKV